MNEEQELTELIARKRRVQGLSPDGVSPAPPRVGEIIKPENILKPIETKYAGYRFRSRLEAKYAVMLDALNVKWKYEHEGFDLGEAGFYLPDFWLESHKLFIEVKPTDPTAEELAKATALNKQSGCRVLICVGTPGDDDEKCIDIPPELIAVSVPGKISAAEMFTDDKTGAIKCLVCSSEVVKQLGFSEDAIEFQCRTGCTFSLKFFSSAIRCYAHIGNVTRITSGLEILVSSDGMGLNQAKARARQARFEHGQSG